MSTVDDAIVLNAILNPNSPFEGEDIPKKDESSIELTYYNFCLSNNFNFDFKKLMKNQHQLPRQKSMK